jgi:hypothetical protein
MLQKILKTLSNKAYLIHTRPFELNIIGVRKNNPSPNSFDDTIYVFYKRKDSQWVINSFAATTDPGTYWLLTLMNPNGTAIVKPGQYINSHRMGVHRKKYQALVQQNPITVWRDANRDNKLDFHNAKEETGIFGINIHRAKLRGTTINVNDHSAGCQVLASADDFNLFMQLAERHKNLYGNNFTYTLLNETDIALIHRRRIIRI